MSAPLGDLSLDELAGRLDEATTRVADAGAADVLDEALAAHTELHRRGVVAMVRALKEDPRGKELLFGLVDVPEVRMLLTVLGVIRPDPTTAATAALEQVRPTLASHGGDASLDRVEDGVAWIRLEGACNGCSMASVTLRETVEAALLAGVPGLTGVEVVANEPAPTVIPLSSIGLRPRDEADDADAAALAASLEQAGWTDTGADDLGAGDLRTATAVDASGSTDVVVVRTRLGVQAYVDRCAHQGLSLANALVDAESGTLTCAWHGFCFDADSGECTSMPGAQLEPLPVRAEAGRIWVRGAHAAVGASAAGSVAGSGAGS
ncbi:NifU family protein [Nocardioides bruguierae]|uniref:NifU family protein n=1 Tax=Nocardioides bruguierae TaxID=2945102 RepID=UPI00201FDC0A|nr:NifU family protein [Nocardioides bruguierae]MCL8025404.1 NifU family protein [Nocardioides bruguierae]